MTTATNATLESTVNAAIREAGLALISAEQGATAKGEATLIFLLGLPGGGAAGHTARLELRAALDLAKPGVPEGLASHLREEAQRLKNPRPDVYVTFGGMPLSITEFAWPFHRSVSGADALIVHGLVTLADGADSQLHAKVAASLTITFEEILAAPEQPYAESFVYNAIRKTLDQGQLEMLKSGGRQPIPVTTRYYSRWKKRFSFIDSDDEARRKFLESKIFWASGVLGVSHPVWIADPRDAQYLNTDMDALMKAASELAAQGLAVPGDKEFAAATPKLMDQADHHRARLEKSLDFTKPTFNEEMRAGHTNM